MATKYEALIEARLVGASIQKAISAQAKDAKVYINNVHVNPSAIRKSIQNQLNAGKFTMNLKDVNVAGLSEKLSASMRKSLGSQKIVLNNITFNTQGLGAKIQKALDGKKFKLNLTEVKIDNLSNQISGKVKQAAKAASAEANAATNAHREQTKAANEAAEAEKKLAQEAAAAAKEQLAITKSSTLSNKISAWMNNNTVAAKKFKTELEDIQKRLNDNPSNGTVYKQAAADFANIQARAKSAGLAVSQFASNFKNLALQMAGLGSAYQIGMKIYNAVKSGVNSVVELDTALVDLRKTTTMSDSDLASFYRDANKEAKELGTTTRQIIQSAADWSRLGFSSKSDATMMARYAAQFAAISPGMNVDQATTGLVSVMKAYGIQTDEVLDGVMSKINRVGNTAATNNAEIIEGLQNSASALAAMNTNLDKSIALFTAGQEIAQQSSKVGNALRSIALRIRGYDEETEQLSEDLVNITGTVVDLTKVASNNYQGVSLFTDASQTEYKDVYDYLQDISEIWDELDAKTKQDLMEKLFGKNRANVCPHVQKCA